MSRLRTSDSKQRCPVMDDSKARARPNDECSQHSPRATLLRSFHVSDARVHSFQAESHERWGAPAAAWAGHWSGDQSRDARGDLSAFGAHGHGDSRERKGESEFSPPAPHAAIHRAQSASGGA